MSVVPLAIFEITLTNTFETREKASMAGSSLDICTFVSGIMLLFNLDLLFCTFEDICPV